MLRVVLGDGLAVHDDVLVEVVLRDEADVETEVEGDEEEEPCGDGTRVG